MWGKIVEASVDPHKSLPYAPYLMHIIEQVVGHSFYPDTPHRSYGVRNLNPQRIRGAAADTPAPAASSPGGAPSSPPRRSSSGRREHDGPIKFALKKFFSYFCYKAERVDRRLRRLEESLNLPPVSPLRRFPDPFDEFDAVHGGAPSTAAGDEDLGGSTGYDTGFAYEDIFGGGAGGSGYVPA